MDATRYLSLLGRLMIGLPFAMSGLGKLAAYGKTTAMIAAAGLPVPPLAYALTVAVELGGGLLILIENHHVEVARRIPVAAHHMLLPQVFHPAGETHSETHHTAVTSLNVELRASWLQRLADVGRTLDSPAEREDAKFALGHVLLGRPGGREQPVTLEDRGDLPALLVVGLHERQPQAADRMAGQLERGLDRDRVRGDAHRGVDVAQ